MTTTLTKIASAAVRIINKGNGVSLKKVAEAGDDHRGAVVYYDKGKEYGEFRVLFFYEGKTARPDYHTDDKQDAIHSARYFAASADTVAKEPELRDEPVATEEARPAQKPKPRGYYARPSGLLAGLLSRV